MRLIPYFLYSTLRVMMVKGDHHVQNCSGQFCQPLGHFSGSFSDSGIYAVQWYLRLIPYILYSTLRVMMVKGDHHIYIKLQTKPPLFGGGF